jgi:hypothetical protein
VRAIAGISPEYLRAVRDTGYGSQCRPARLSVEQLTGVRFRTDAVARAG